ncbi:MAG: phnP [Bacteroidota bacterium]|jgi:phosphoribosyl 1,2-cyclic phosphate phosphodiesterase|nr:phnP [Bacteroidota bacterium]
MKVTFLGTGTSQGVPIICCECSVCHSKNPKDNRLRSSILIESETTAVVIDSGPDFRQQMLRQNVKSLDAVVFTHEHKDHIAGLDEVKAFNFFNRMRMPVYASLRVQEALKREFHYIFSDDKYPGIPEIDLHTITNEHFNINDIELIPIDVLHYRLPVKAYRINDFTYITDANYITEHEKQKIRGSRIIVVNALRKEEHVSHFTFQQAIDLMKEFNPEKAYFTHISHQLGFHDEVSKELPSFIELAYDGLQVKI